MLAVGCELWAVDCGLWAERDTGFRMHYSIATRVSA